MTAQLLDAAEALYAEEGVSALTNRRIAARAGTTIQPIYSFFRSHDNLVDAMFGRCLESLAELVMDTHTGTVAGGRGSLPEVYRSYCLAYPGRFRFVRSGGDGTSKAGLARHQRDLLANAFEKLVGPDSSVNGTTVLAAVNGFILAEIEGMLTAEDGVDELFKGLLGTLTLEID